MPTDSITFAMVDDHAMFRAGLVSLLSEYSQIKILFEAGNGLEMIEQLKAHGCPDVMLMDINMRGMDGHEATSWLKQKYPHVHILALSMYEDDTTIIKMIRNGAGGYILKESHVQELVQAIITIHKTGYYINDIISGRLVRTLQGDAGPDVSLQEVLSPRELEFTKLSCSELTYKEIADEMKVSPRTVDGYRQAVFEKLQLKSRVGLVLYAIENGLFKINLS
jgi:DNA-binding NarL/FixJ family response regulator